ncbi:type II toxin-antitoxin system VapB family antitoxin [Dickeya chrysanthemi]|uniref:type II toxin-antitoxin system VapB family antitoxin n=1 Tax=Dickeya chrysanthemi TaxID=556 RepID=UPI00039DCC36|nr:type II toxin-antitoxin system VapB family antitoxin [Dickeya chrysanthemi]
MEKATVFKSNRSQAVRLPKAVALPDDVRHVAIGRTRIITLAGESWDSWFDEAGVTPDFMNTREQPDEQIKDDFGY